MVDFGAMFDKIRGKDEQEEEQETNKSDIPRYIMPLLPAWFQGLPVMVQNMMWNMAKGYISSGGDKEAESGGMDFGSILGGVMGIGGSKSRSLSASRSCFSAAPGATPDNEQQSWACIVAAAKCDEGRANLDEWPFNDPLHGEKCREIASGLKAI